MTLYIKKELKFAFWARKDSTGVYPYGSTGTLANGSGAMMARARGFTGFDVNQNEPELKTLVADGGIIHSYRADPTVAASASMAMLVLDQDLSAAAVDSTLFTEGAHSVELIGNTCITQNTLALVLCFVADVYNSGNGLYEEKWLMEEYLDADAFPLNASGAADPSADPNTFSYALSFEEPTKTLDGVTIILGNYNRTKGYLRRYTSANPIIFGTFVGDAVATTYVIDSAYVPGGESATYLQLWIDGVEKAYTTDFTISGQTITFVAAPGTGAVVIFKLEFDGSAC